MCTFLHALYVCAVCGPSVCALGRNNEYYINFDYPYNIMHIIIQYTCVQFNKITRRWRFITKQCGRTLRISNGVFFIFLLILFSPKHIEYPSDKNVFIFDICNPHTRARSHGTEYGGERITKTRYWISNVVLRYGHLCMCTAHCSHCPCGKFVFWPIYYTIYARPACTIYRRRVPVRMHVQVIWNYCTK